MTKLTKRVVDAIRPDSDGKELFTWDEGDGALKGFGIRTMPSGVSSYFIQYRNAEGRTRRLVVGKVGVLTPDEAREEAREKLRDATRGADPSAERKAVRAALNVSDICDWYLEQARNGGLLGRGGRRIKESTLAMDESRIKAHVKPLIGSRTVNGLTLNDIEKLQADIAAGKSAKGVKAKRRGGKTTGGTGVASRTVGMLRTIFEAAARKKQVKHNPAAGVKRHADGKAKRFLSVEELVTLGKAMRDLEPVENRRGLAAIRALVLTGCRRMEVLALPWTWLDIKGRCIRFEDTKSGAQLRPIGADAVKHLEAQPRESDGKWVFPADRGDGHFVGLPRVLERVCGKAELDGVTVHSLRHTFASVAAEMGFSELTIAGLLGHTVPGVTARYAHVPDRALLAAADAVAARIATALDGKIEAVVIPLQGRG